MRDEILDRLTKFKAVSFVELEREIPGFKWEENNVFQLMYPDPQTSNIIVWQLSERGSSVITDLLKEKKIILTPTELLTYLVDGLTLDLPIAKRIKHYKNPHWLPMVIDLAK